jgi:hypothetical protein
MSSVENRNWATAPLGDFIKNLAAQTVSLNVSATEKRQQYRLVQVAVSLRPNAPPRDEQERTA